MKPHSNWWWVAALIPLLWLSIAASAEESPVGAAITNPFAGRDDLVAEGKSLFNLHCSHCHGPNAVQGERTRDLRRLSRRYGNKLPAVFYMTATGGREEKGMPSWRGALADETLWKIFTFLQTDQKK